MATILLVDDDPLQAFVRKSVLEKRFPDVRRVADAAEALCLVEQPHFARSLGLVITGNMMPGISRATFVAELLTRMPSLPVLVLGNPRDEISEFLGGSVCFLPGPVVTEKIVATVSSMLAQNERKTA